MVQMLNEKPKLQQLTIKPFKRCECEMRPFEEWMNQMNISKTAAMYIVEKDVKSGITTWMYIPEEKKEKKMKETNLQHYKEELKTIFNEYYKEPSKIIREIEALIGVEIKGYCFQSCTDAILIWMAQPYKKPILDEVEKKYLSDVIRPFRKKVKHIVIWDTCNGSKQFVHIKLYDEDCINLPNFKPNAMYKGMELHKEYTLKELGL